MNEKREIVESIFRISDLFKEIGESSFLNEHSITALQFNILGVILEEGAKTIQDIRQKLIISSASLSQTINRMEKKELIKRIYGKGDKRYVGIDVTKEGNLLFYKLRDIYEKVINDKLFFLSKKEQETLLKILIKIETNLVYEKKDKN